MVIIWAPTPVEELMQNVATLIGTETGSVPLSRAMGTPQDIVDQPQTVAGARLQAAIFKAVRTYEPRAGIESVSLHADVDGKLSATVKVGAP